MFDTKSIRKDSGPSEHSKTALGLTGSSHRLGFGYSRWCVVVALLLLVSPSFAQAPSERIADEREIIDAIDESGVPVSDTNIREILEAVVRGIAEKMMALHRELDRPYKEKGDPFGAPTREAMKLTVVVDDAVLDRLVAFIQRKTTERPVDWSVVKPAVQCLGAAPGDHRVVTACQAVFSVPLEDPENKTQTACLVRAIVKLARQCTPAALETLRQCTKLGTSSQVDVLPASSILKDTHGNPSSLAAKLAQTVAICVEDHASPDVMAAFFSDVERDTREIENHPLRGRIDMYIRDAELIQRGQDPHGIP